MSSVDSGGETVNATAGDAKASSTDDQSKKDVVNQPTQQGAPAAGTSGVAQAGGTQPSFVQFSTEEFILDQGVATLAEITVTRTGSVAGTTSVDYQTSDVSGVAGIDYSPAHGTLTFTDGDADKKFDVAILKRPTRGNTNLLVELLSPQGAALGNPKKAVLTICPVRDSQSTLSSKWSWGWVETVAQYLIFALTGAAFVYFIITTGQSLVSSKDTGLNTLEAARSLITFLIAACTVGIALVLTLASIIGTGPDVKERFAQGKEILTILIGVLGTIVGFYFGQATKPSAPAEAGIAQSQNLQISPPTISKLTPAKGEKTSITTKVTGGRPPYKYSITFIPSGIVPDLTDGNSADGTITQEVTIPDSLQKDTVIRFTITVKDADGKSVTFDDPSRQFTAKVSTGLLGMFLIERLLGHPHGILPPNTSAPDRYSAQGSPLTRPPYTWDTRTPFG